MNFDIKKNHTRPNIKLQKNGEMQWKCLLYKIMKYATLWVFRHLNPTLFWTTNKMHASNKANDDDNVTMRSTKAVARLFLLEFQKSLLPSV